MANNGPLECVYVDEVLDVDAYTFLCRLGDGSIYVVPRRRVMNAFSIRRGMQKVTMQLFPEPSKRYDHAA